MTRLMLAIISLVLIYTDYKRLSTVAELKLANAEVQNQRLVISEYSKYYEACLSNLNDMERTCHK